MMSRLKNLIIICIPLVIRKWLAIWINRQRWLTLNDRGWWATQLILDLAKNDITAYHKFLWRHHLSYAETYEAGLRFGYDKFNRTRQLFLADLKQHLADAGLRPDTQINSVFDAGCSLGYLLHYLETDIFPNSTILEGNDIDKYCIEQGRLYLATQNSKINLIHADMESLGEIIGDKKYDVVICTGVLLYLKQEQAKKLVARMMKRTNIMLAFTGLAHPEIDNAKLTSSSIRERDKTWIHNIDRMVSEAGGRIIARRWEGSKIVDGNTVYFVFAVPPA